MRESRHLIYGLVDPRDARVFYVGRSCSGLKRPRQHWRPAHLAKWAHLHVARKIRQILAAGELPGVLVLERCAGADDLNDAEVRWIAHYRAAGVRLTNLTDGGGGTSGWVPSAEWRRKVAAANTGKTMLPDTRRKLSLSHTGWSPSEETRKKISALKMRQTPETRRKIAEAVRAHRAAVPRGHSPETKRRIAESVRRTLARRRVSGGARA